MIPPTEHSSACVSSLWQWNKNQGVKSLESLVEEN